MHRNRHVPDHRPDRRQHRSAVRWRVDGLRDKGTAKALSTALRSLLFLGGLVPTNDADPDASNVERGEAPVRSAVQYLDEICNPHTSAGRLRQIHYELGSTRQLGALVTNEVGEEEQIGAMVVRIGKERAAGGGA